MHWNGCWNAGCTAGADSREACTLPAGADSDDAHPGTLNCVDNTFHSLSIGEVVWRTVESSRIEW